MKKVKCKICTNCNKERKYKCPDCGSNICGNCSHMLNGEFDFLNNKCFQVLGKSGWRELGIYNG